MTETPRPRVKYVIGPDGSPLTIADLPPVTTRRWVIRRKAEVVAAVREGGGELLEDVRLFDVYAGEQLGEGKKSLALALRFRAADRTLKQEEATVARDAAVQLAADRLGAALRS